MRIILLEFWSVVSSTSWIQVDQECYMKSPFFLARCPSLSVSSFHQFLCVLIFGFYNSWLVFWHCYFFFGVDSVFVLKKITKTPSTSVNIANTVQISWKLLIAGKKRKWRQAFSQVNIEKLANFIYCCCNGCQGVHKSRRDAFHIIIETNPSKLYADAEGMILISENLVYGVFLLYLSLYFNPRAWKKKNPHL